MHTACKTIIAITHAMVGLVTWTGVAMTYGHHGYQGPLTSSTATATAVYSVIQVYDWITDNSIKGGSALRIED